MGGSAEQRRVIDEHDESPIILSGMTEHFWNFIYVNNFPPVDNRRSFSREKKNPESFRTILTSNMETMRLILIFIHVLIIIFLLVHIHPSPNETTKATNRRQKFSAIVFHIIGSLRIILYHSASIIAVWFSRQYGASVVRASGILLIAELLQLTTDVIHRMLEVEHLPSDELYFLPVLDLLLIIALVMTFRLADKLSKFQRNLMQIELLAENCGTSAQQ